MERIRAGWLGLMVAGAGMVVGGNTAEAGPTRVIGRVVDPAGKPVAGADVGTTWNFKAGKLTPSGGTRTDADGKFQFQAEFYDQPGAVLAVDAGRQVGGLVTVAPNKGQNRFLLKVNQFFGEPVQPKLPPPLDPVEIKVGPLVRVHGNFDCPRPGQATGLDQCLHDVWPRQNPGRPVWLEGSDL